MGSKRKAIPLTWKTGSILFLICFVVSVAAVHFLRQALIPKEELDCYARVITLQKAVDQWNVAHPDQIIKDEINEDSLVKAGFLQPLTYDHDLHYYFVGETAHGPRVKCNKHEDNPLVLRLTGDLLLAVLVFLVVCSIRGYAFFAPEQS